MPTKSKERALLGFTIRTWHAVSALCMIAIGVLYVVSTVATSEIDADEFVIETAVGLALIAGIWLTSLRVRSRYLLMAWPAYLTAALALAHYETPEAAQLVLGTMVLGFMLTGLTQPRWMFAALLPPAIAAYVLVVPVSGVQLGIRLLLAVSIWIAVATLPAWLTSRLRQTGAQFAVLADTDQLTRLPNRRAWDARLATLLRGEDDRELVVGLADLDCFKIFNDTYGHLEGDLLLEEFADALRSSVKDADIVARWGGEEFAFVLRNCTIDDAIGVAERVRAAMPREETCSVGLAAWMPGDDADSITERADRALYRAKENGRDRVEVGGAEEAGGADEAREIV